jgi:flagellar hook assembly protein FlgD
LGVETPSFIPEKFQTLSAYPNPFNPSITFQLELQNITQTNMNAEVNIYDINGRFIQTLLENSIESGVHRITWRPQNISSGIYIVSLQTEIGIKNQKILYLK